MAILAVEINPIPAKPRKPTLDEQKNINRHHLMEHVFTVKWKEMRKAYDSSRLSSVFILIVNFSHPVTTCRVCKVSCREDMVL